MDIPDPTTTPSFSSVATPPPPAAGSAVGSPGSRHVAFNLHVLVHGCSNIPQQTNARVYCKWKLRTRSHAHTAIHHGVLPPTETTRSHLVVWDAVIELPGCVFKMDTLTKQLKPLVLRLSIRQESRTALKGFTRLGIVCLDLAEFAGQTHVDRTYLLEKSRLNSTLSFKAAGLTVFVVAGDGLSCASEKSRLNSTLSVTVSAAQVSGDVMFRRRLSSGSSCHEGEDGSTGNRLSRRMKTPSGATITMVSSPASPMQQLQLQPPSPSPSPHTIYQVVGDILRISEENRLSRHSSHLDATLQ